MTNKNTTKIVILTALIVSIIMSGCVDSDNSGILSISIIPTVTSELEMIQETENDIKNKNNYGVPNNCISSSGAGCVPVLKSGDNITNNISILRPPRPIPRRTPIIVTLTPLPIMEPIPVPTQKLNPPKPVLVSTPDPDLWNPPCEINDNADTDIFNKHKLIANIYKSHHDANVLYFTYIEDQSDGRCSSFLGRNERLLEEDWEPRSIDHAYLRYLKIYVNGKLVVEFEPTVYCARIGYSVSELPIFIKLDNDIGQNPEIKVIGTFKSPDFKYDGYHYLITDGDHPLRVAFQGGSFSWPSIADVENLTARERIPEIYSRNEYWNIYPVLLHNHDDFRTVAT